MWRDEGAESNFTRQFVWEGGLNFVGVGREGPSLSLFGFIETTVCYVLIRPRTQTLHDDGYIDIESNDEKNRNTDTVIQ